MSLRVLALRRSVESCDNMCPSYEQQQSSKPTEPGWLHWPPSVEAYAACSSIAEPRTLWHVGLSWWQKKKQDKNMSTRISLACLARCPMSLWLSLMSLARGMTYGHTDILTDTDVVRTYRCTYNRCPCCSFARVKIVGCTVEKLKTWKQLRSWLFVQLKCQPHFKSSIFVFPNYSIWSSAILLQIRNLCVIDKDLLILVNTEWLVLSIKFTIIVSVGRRIKLYNTRIILVLLMGN